MTIVQSQSTRRLAASAAALALGFWALLFVLHGAQPLAFSGPARNPSSFETLRKHRYLIVVRGTTAQPIMLSLRAADGALLSNELLLQPRAGRPDAPRWGILRASARASDVRVSVGGIAQPEIAVRAIDENAPRRKWIASLLFLASLGWFCIVQWRRRWVQALAVGVGYFLFLLPWHYPAFFAAADNKLYVPTGQSLFERGDWNVDEFGGPDPVTTFKDEYFVKRGKDGHFYNLYPPGTTILTLPIIFVGDWLADQFPDPMERAAIVSELAAKIISAATVALLYLVLLALTERRTLSWILLGVFAFATSQLSVHGGGLWSHNTSAFLAVIALGLWIWQGGRHAVWSAIPLTLGMICRPTMLIPALVFASALLLRDWKKCAAFVLLVLIGMSAFAFHSLGIWGQLLPIYYTGSATAPGTGPLAFLGTLVSPNRGLFIYSPVLIFALLGGALAWRRGTPALYRMASAACFFEWILASHNGFWWGGHCYGPRLLCEALPFAVLLLIPAWELLERQRHRRTFLTFGAVAFGWSVFVQFQALLHPQVYQWNARPNVDQHPERLWNWHDWQILAGERAEPPN